MVNYIFSLGLFLYQKNGKEGRWLDQVSQGFVPSKCFGLQNAQGAPRISPGLHGPVCSHTSASQVSALQHLPAHWSPLRLKESLSIHLLLGCVFLSTAFAFPSLPPHSRQPPEPGLTALPSRSLFCLLQSTLISPFSEDRSHSRPDPSRRTAVYGEQSTGLARYLRETHTTGRVRIITSIV